MRDDQTLDAIANHRPGEAIGLLSRADEGRAEGQGRDQAEDAGADQQSERELRGRPDADQEPAGARELPEALVHERVSAAGYVQLRRRPQRGRSRAGGDGGDDWRRSDRPVQRKILNLVGRV